MESFSLNALEWPVVLDHLARHAATRRGQAWCRELPFAADRDAAWALQVETAEARALVEADGAIPLGGITDLRETLDRARKGAVLEPHFLLEVGTTQRGARILKQYAQSRVEQAPRLAIIVAPLPLAPGLEEAIHETFRQDGSIHDHATSDLSRIRTDLRETQTRIRQKLQRIIQSTQYKSVIQDPVISQREGRYLLPVKVEGQSVLKGLVHDQSASGATVYLEPMAVVEDNNRLRRLQAAERAEIERILAVLSNQVARFADALEAQGDLLAQIDAIVARAGYAIALGGIQPVLSETGRLRLDGARHPLLVPKLGRANVVPLDMALPFGETLVITGPNTGGKTVALKTMGLLALMAKAGLQVPADPTSELPVFSKVLADIGDEQSLEQSLSTFSGHMHHLTEILASVDAASLVLIDEIGTGTDPTEGAALAQAIIEGLRHREITTVVTTHYGTLKALAYNQAGIHNAATEFADETLAPTYRLLMGQPGRSNALAIARRLGLDPEIIDRARILIGHERQDLEHVIAELANEGQALIREREALASSRRNLDAERAVIADKQEKFDAEIEQWRTGTQQTLGADIVAARQQVADLVRSLQQAGTAQAAQQVKDQLDQISQHHGKRRDRAALAPVWQVGQTVMISRLGTHGTIVAGPDGSGQVQVQIGSIKTTVSVDEIRPVRGGTKLPKSAHRGLTSASMPVTAVASWELDLRGKMAVEALDELDQFMDNAFSSNHKTLFIIHGKGTGALRAAIQTHLKTSPYVGSFRSGTLPEGGAGVTVIELAS